MSLDDHDLVDYSDCNLEFLMVEYDNVIMKVDTHENMGADTRQSNQRVGTHQSRAVNDC